MTDKEVVKAIIESTANLCDIDDGISDDVRRKINMTLEEHLKDCIERYYALLRETPTELLKTKISDLIGKLHHLILTWDS